MPRYKDHNQLQTEILFIDYTEQLVPGTFEYALNHIIDHEIDLSDFESVFKNDLTGAPGFDPRGMLKIVLYAYSLGILYTRKIQKACETNTTFMALSGNMRPDHSTISRFISGMGKRANTLFTDVLLLCDKLGLIGRNMFAIDGCKISSNASKEWSGKIKDFERRKKKMEEEVKKLLKRHKELDETKEDLKEQIEKEKRAIENYKKKIKKMADFIKKNDDRISSAGNVVQSNITDPESAKLKSSNGIIQGYNGIAAVDSKHQVIVNAQAFGEGNERASVNSMIKGIENNLNDSFKDGSLSKTIVTADTGFNSENVLKSLDAKGVDAYIPDPHFRKRDPKFEGNERYDRPVNRQKTTRKKNYFSRDDFVYDRKNNQFICPAGETLYKSGKPRKVDDYIFQKYKGRDSKCPNCHLRAKCIQGKKSKIKQYNVQIKNLKEKPFSKKMKEKIDTIQGRFIYSRRMGIVEPVFAHICHILKLKYFTLKSRLKVNGQWNLFATVHNMLKLFRYAPLFA